MKKYTLEFSVCADCPNARLGYGGAYCIITGHDLFDPLHTTPEDCPLEELV